jgi:hypothetical protein
MAIDDNFVLFLIPAILALAAAAFALPSKNRIERDPSTAYRRGKRAMVNLAVVLTLIIGLLLLFYGQTQNAQDIFTGVNMIMIGGISLIAMGAVLIGTSAVIRSQIKSAGRGEDEMVLEVAAVGAPPVQPTPEARADVPPRPYPPPAPRRVPRERPPPDPYGRNGQRPQYDDGAQPPPYRPPPRRRPPEY